MGILSAVLFCVLRAVPSIVFMANVEGGVRRGDLTTRTLGVVMGANVEGGLRRGT